MRPVVQAIWLGSIFIVCTGLTLGLTYAPCYASLCTEEFLPADTRYHIATYYALIASVVIALVLRRYSPACYRISTTYLTQKEVPIFKKRFSIGGVAIALWIIIIILVTTVFWFTPLKRFWGLRTEPLNWPGARVPLVVTGLIGHHADLPLGLLLIPVGRNSMLVQVFRLQYGTLLYAHKLIAYTTIVAAYAHGVAYCFFWARYNAQPNSSARTAAFEVNNPTITVAESHQRGPWSRATLGTGLASFVLMIVVLVTALPYFRRRAYNTFYYIHIILGIIILVGTCVHASTNFYCVLPGLLLWIIDWAWRLFKGDSGLSKEVEVTISSAGGGWYRMVLPLPNKCPFSSDSSDNESQVEKHASLHPLQTYYVTIPSISKVENHAFTAAKVISHGSSAVLLFQKVPVAAIKRSPKAQDREWTWKLARLIDEFDPQDGPQQVRMRVEGPYMPATKAFATTNKVICIVGGTGLTGAYSLARWWNENRKGMSDYNFHLVWTVRFPETLLLREWTELCTMCAASDNMTLTSHCSSEQGRMDVADFLRLLLADGGEKKSEGQGGAWVYASGPNGLLSASADACIAINAEIRRARKGGALSGFSISALDHYTADWEV